MVKSPLLLEDYEEVNSVCEDVCVYFTAWPLFTVFDYICCWPTFVVWNRLVEIEKHLHAFKYFSHHRPEQWFLTATGNTGCKLAGIPLPLENILFNMWFAPAYHSRSLEWFQKTQRSGEWWRQHCQYHNNLITQIDLWRHWSLCPSSLWGCLQLLFDTSEENVEAFLNVSLRIKGI